MIERVNCGGMCGGQDICVYMGTILYIYSAWDVAGKEEIVEKRRQPLTDRCTKAVTLRRMDEMLFEGATRRR